MSEYYTPTIDEFCLGFEFEYFEREFNEDNEYIDSKWIPSQVVLSDTNKAGTTHLGLKDINLQYYQIGLALMNKTIRVKKLSIQDLIDITDSNYIYLNGIEHPHYGGLCFTLKSMINIFAYPYAHLGQNLSTNEAIQYLYIEPIARFEYTTSRKHIGNFNGKIQNKTELIKLLKQLNIEINENTN